jgi:hypothetical protein
MPSNTSLGLIDLTTLRQAKQVLVELGIKPPKEPELDENWWK